MWGRVYRPFTLDRWLNAPRDAKPRANVGFGRAWRMTREILRERTSHSYAALAGWTYIPTGAEAALWDRFDLEKRLQRKGWRPWADKSRDPFREERMETAARRGERMRRRRRLRERYHITD